MSLAIACDGPGCEEVWEGAVYLDAPSLRLSDATRRHLTRDGWTNVPPGTTRHLCPGCTEAAAVAYINRRRT